MLQGMVKYKCQNQYTITKTSNNHYKNKLEI